MKYFIIETTKFKQNTLIIWCKKTKEAAIVDPGGEVNKIFEKINKKKLIAKKILLTHGHIDHVGGVAEIARYYKIKILGPNKKDIIWLNKLFEQSQFFNLPICKNFTPDYWLEEGDTINIGKNIFSVLHCPGHTPGHIIFFNKDKKLLISGDILFQKSIGSTNFPNSSLKNLMESIYNKIIPLGDNVTFIPGHGPISNIKYEKKYNPFLKKIL